MNRNMKTRLVIFLALIFIWGCGEEESPTSAVPGFTGITERDEWGDTLSVDTTDWVIVGGFPSYQSSGPIALPIYRDGKRLQGGVNLELAEQPEYSIGAFPNPFIPGAGRLLISLVLPVDANVELHAEDASGEHNITIMDAPLPLGIHLISWDGKGVGGATLPEGIYRIFYQAGFVSGFGDVQIIISGVPDPPTNAAYVLYAQDYLDFTEYSAYEYSVATQFGWDGQPGGNDTYPSNQTAWSVLNYENKFSYLPVFMNYDLLSADSYQYHYLLAYKQFQFGAGWPDDGDVGIVDPNLPEWQKSNSYHNTYVDLFEQGP